jgi:hypothetical protein
VAGFVFARLATWRDVVLAGFRAALVAVVWPFWRAVFGVETGFAAAVVFFSEADLNGWGWPYGRDGVDFTGGGLSVEVAARAGPPPATRMQRIVARARTFFSLPQRLDEPEGPVFGAVEAGGRIA